MSWNISIGFNVDGKLLDASLSIKHDLFVKVSHHVKSLFVDILISFIQMNTIVFKIFVDK